MEGTKFVVALVAIGAVTSIIKSWINRHREDNQIDQETFNRLAQAFIQHKKNMQERVENLEAIIAEREIWKIGINIRCLNETGTMKAG